MQNRFKAVLMGTVILGSLLGVLASGCNNKTEDLDTKAPPPSANAVPDTHSNGPKKMPPAPPTMGAPAAAKQP